jgi:hypothetical protein|tara:strand:+ start:212 stop:733 length:522 start_codon:yes stop_codon:yes gene_type:complete
MTFITTSIIWICFNVFLTLFLVFKHIRIESAYYTKLEELENEVTFLEEKIFEILPQGYSREELCDRKNPWHSQIHWYLKSIEEGTDPFPEEEIKHYEELIELNDWYLVYKDQPLQGYRNDSVIWQKSWCHKWSDGLGMYGIGHDYWVAGEFEYQFKTNTEFATWLTSETNINQ